MRRQGLQLVVGLLVGLLGAALVFVYVRRVEERAAGAEATVPVLRADEAILAGTPGGELEGAVTLDRIPRRFAPENAVGSLEDLRGLYATERIEEGQPLLRTMFGTAGATRSGRLAIPQGKEAISVVADIDSGMAQYLAPGDEVSVYATFTRGTDHLTRKILANVPVLATEVAGTGAAQRITGATPNELVLVLAVSPRQAGRLVFAKETGSIWMTLVPQGQRSPMVAPVRLGTAGGRGAGGREAG